MRSMFMLAALAAVIGFTGCCGTGGSCKLGGCLGGGKGLIKADRGCDACGAGSVVTTSAPYACDGGCGSSAPMSIPSSGGCSSCSGGGAVPLSVPSSGGCSSCNGGGEIQYSAPVEYAPVQSGGCSSCNGGGATQYSGPVEYAPVQSGGCEACGSASADKPRGLLPQRVSKKLGLSGNKGMGLGLKGKGKACNESRSLRPSRGAGFVLDRGVVTGDVDSGCSSCVQQTVAQAPGGFLFGGSNSERRISTGIISDIREARGGCSGGGCAAHKLAGGGRLPAGPLAGGGGLATGRIAGGCGKRGCSIGDLCSKCTKRAQAVGLGHPYGGGIPHTNPAVGQQPQSGIAPQYAYPYYTTRGPRDFLRDNPPSIGY